MPNNDDLAEVRKKIKELESSPPFKADCQYKPYDKEGKHYDPFTSNPICRDCFADQILNIKVKSGGGECPECKGEGKVWNWGNAPTYSYDIKVNCPTCKGTGTLDEEKSIGDIVKEWDNARS